MVYDRDAEGLREVDILVDYRCAHHDLRIAIECRDRSRKDSVEWIDSLIGKAKSLSASKVVAVSKEGFTQAARAKARANGIETLTLEDAIDTDWSSFPFKPGIVIIGGADYRLHDVLYKRNDKYYSLKELDLTSSVFLNGEDCGPIKDIFERFFCDHLLPFIQGKRKEIMDLFKTRADVDKIIGIEIDRTFPGIYVRLPFGEEVDISLLRFIIIGSLRVKEVDKKHYKFNELMVSVGEHLDSDGSTIKFNLVQDPESRRLYGKWQRVPPNGA